MKTHKAILIDSLNRTVNMCDIGDFRHIQSVIGCDCFGVATQLADNDVIYVDDEGLLNVNAFTPFFTFEGAHQPFAGNGLICGGDDEGETRDVKITVEEVKRKVKFHTLAQVRAQCSQEDFA